MSGVANPQMLPPPPKQRGMRRLTKMPATVIIIIVALLTLLIILVWWALGIKIAYKDNEDYALSAQAPVVMHQDEQTPTPPVPPDAKPAAPQAPPVDPMAEIRKKAWERFYREWDEHQGKVHQAQFDAMTASPTGTSQIGAGGPQIAQPQMGPNGQPIYPGQPGYVAGVGGGGAGGGGGGGGSDRDRQLAFLHSGGSDPSTDYLANSQGLARPTQPISRWEIKTGTIITATLITKMNSDTPGHMLAQISGAVVDSNGNETLIPQGAKLWGTYDTAISYGQTRMVAGFTRILYPPPGNESLDIGMMGGSDMEGAAGFEDITNNHLGKIFLNAGLLALFSAGIQLSQPQPVNGFGGSTYSSGQIAAGAAAQQLGQLGMEFARKGLDIPPTEEIRKGYQFSILVTHDIAMPGYWKSGHFVYTDQQVNAVQ